MTRSSVPAAVPCTSKLNSRVPAETKTADGARTSPDLDRILKVIDFAGGSWSVIVTGTGVPIATPRAGNAETWTAFCRRVSTVARPSVTLLKYASKAARYDSTWETSSGVGCCPSGVTSRNAIRNFR
jgi:hypothetical protein